MIVTSVEGTDSLSSVIIKQAIEEYAKECGFKYVLYNSVLLNNTPNQFLEHVLSYVQEHRQNIKTKNYKVEFLSKKQLGYYQLFSNRWGDTPPSEPRGNVRGVLMDLNSKKRTQAPAFSKRDSIEKEIVTYPIIGIISPKKTQKSVKLSP